MSERELTTSITSGASSGFGLVKQKPISNGTVAELARAAHQAGLKPVSELEVTGSTRSSPEPDAGLTGGEASLATSFSLDSSFIAELQRQPERFGFQGVGEVVMKRTYARDKRKTHSLTPAASPSEKEGEFVMIGRGEGKKGLSTGGPSRPETMSPASARRVASGPARSESPGAAGKEAWWEITARVINGTGSMYKNHMTHNGLPWDEADWQKYAQRMAKSLFAMKWTPPGRGLWAMGTPITNKKHLYAALNNCAFVSTRPGDDATKPFRFTMDMSMLGVGVGFDTAGAGLVDIKCPSNIAPDGKVEQRLAGAYKVSMLEDGHLKINENKSCYIRAPVNANGLAFKDSISFNMTEPKVETVVATSYSNVHTVVIDDSREGWVDSLGQLLRAYFYGERLPTFDYSQLRPAGSPLNTFGGTSSGPGPLRELHERVSAILGPRIGQKLSSRDIVDIGNAIGAAVAAGGIRRSAEIALGEPDDEDFQRLKDFDRPENKYRLPFAHASNNSVKAKIGMDYGPAVSHLISNGEPGFIWLENMQAYGRMSDAPDYRDKRVEGCNPCITGDTLVRTSKGIKSALELVGVPFEAEIDGNYYPSSKGFWCSGEKPVFKVTLVNGATVRATSNHRFVGLTAKGMRSWCTVNFFRPGDTLLVAPEAKDGKSTRDPSDIDIWRAMARDERDEPQYYEADPADVGSVIKSIEPDGVAKVYDCTVEDVHAYTLANGIVSHNCSEIGLESYELCCLSEVFPADCNTLDEFLEILSYAYHYTKIVTLGQSHWPETNAVMLRNRRIGISVSGIAQFLEYRGMGMLKQWLSEGYKHLKKLDVEFSAKLAIRESIKLTTCKPSGSVSLLAGATPGVHYPLARYYKRRIIFRDDDPVLACVKQAGYYSEPSKYVRGSTVAEFPVDVYASQNGALAGTAQNAEAKHEGLTMAAFVKPGLLKQEVIDGTAKAIRATFDKLTEPGGTAVASSRHAERKTKEIKPRTLEEVTMREQLEIAANLQQWWADNQVSVTITFRPHEARDIQRALDLYQHRLKSVSFLAHKSEAYEQAPYETITREEYERRTDALKPIDWSPLHGLADCPDAVGEAYCDAGTCDLDFSTRKKVKATSS